MPKSATEPSPISKWLMPRTPLSTKPASTLITETTGLKQHHNANFQKHFNTAHGKAKRKQRTTQPEGYHGANAVLQTNDYLQAENKAAMEALASMDTAIMSADRSHHVCRQDHDGTAHQHNC
jgi:hypothetical protein